MDGSAENRSVPRVGALDSSQWTMSERITRRFRVEDRRDDVVWLTLLESGKRGLQFGVYYDGFREELSEGERITATVESLNDRNTAWRIKELK